MGVELSRAPTAGTSAVAVLIEAAPSARRVLAPPAVRPAGGDGGDGRGPPGPAGPRSPAVAPPDHGRGQMPAAADRSRVMPASSSAARSRAPGSSSAEPTGTTTSR